MAVILVAVAIGTNNGRTPLRNAFDELRHHVKTIFAREGNRLLVDANEARDDYISILIDPSPLARADFIARHARDETVSKAAQIEIWNLLEGVRNAMFMYTSCGWFFSDLAGVEPVQNMRYALRAAEIFNPYTEVDLIALLTDRLAGAKSNVEACGTGADLFKREVLSSRYDMQHAVSAAVMMQQVGLPVPKYAYAVDILDSTVNDKYMFGVARVTDVRTTASKDMNFVSVIIDANVAGVLFPTTAPLAFYQQVQKWDTAQLLAELKTSGIELSMLPHDERESNYCGFNGAGIRDYMRAGI